MSALRKGEDAHYSRGFRFPALPEAGEAVTLPDAMELVTTEDRVDRLEAMFGHLLVQMGVFDLRAEERSKAADARMNRLEDEIRASKRELDKKWGDLANKLGTIIEDIVAPNLRRLAVEHFGFATIEDFMIRRSRRQGGRQAEFDALVVGPAVVILGEANSNPTLAAAEELAAKMALFFDFFPEYRGRRLITVLGSWAIADNVVERLTALGIYAMRMGQDTMELANANILDRGPGAGER
jgi:hypothetical protein